MKPSYDVAGNLGDVELRLGKHLDAAEHLSWSLRKWPAGRLEAKQKTEALLAQARAEVGTVRVKVNVVGAKVTVGDRKLGASPIDQDIFVTPGAVQVSATASGYKDARRTLAVAKGETKSADLVLEPTAGAPPDGPADQNGGVHVSSDGMQPRTVALITGGALTAVSLGAAVFFHLKRNSADDDFTGLQTELNQGGNSGTCVNSANPKCGELMDALERRDDAARFRNVALIGAGVFGAATVATLVFWPEPSRRSASVSLNAVPSLEGAQLSLGGTF